MDQRASKGAEKVACIDAGAVQQPGEAGKSEEGLSEGEGLCDADDTVLRADPDCGGDRRKRCKSDRREAASAVARNADRVADVVDLRDGGADREPAKDGRGFRPLVAEDEADKFVRNRHGESGKGEGEVSDDVGAGETLLDELGRSRREARKDGEGDVGKRAGNVEEGEAEELRGATVKAEGVSAEESTHDDNIELLDEVVEKMIPSDAPAIAHDRACPGEVRAFMRPPGARAPGQGGVECFGNERKGDKRPGAGAEHGGGDHRDGGGERCDRFNAAKRTKFETAGEERARDPAGGVEDETQAEGCEDRRKRCRGVEVANDRSGSDGEERENGAEEKMDAKQCGAARFVQRGSLNHGGTEAEVEEEEKE